MQKMVHRSTRQFAALSAALALAFLILPTWGAEKVQIRGSTTIELPKPKNSLEEIRTFRLDNGPTGQSEYEGGVSAAAPVNNNAPQLDKKLQEMIDKKKNWIFINPYEMQFDSKTEEFMKGEKGTGLYDHRLMQDEEKTVLEKFMDEKKHDRETDPNAQDAADPDRAAGANGEMLGTMRGAEVKPEQNTSSLTVEKAQSLQFKLEQKASFSSERSLFQQKLERTPFGDNAMSDKFSETRSSVPKEDFRKERETREVRDTEMNKLFQSRSFAPPVATGFDPLNSAPDATRLEVNPIGPRRSEQFLNLGRSESAGGGIAATRNSPVFSGNSPVFSGASSGGNLPGRSVSEGFGATIGRPAAVAPSSSFAPPVAARPANQAPFSVPIPQRKF